MPETQGYDERYDPQDGDIWSAPKSDTLVRVTFIVRRAGNSDSVHFDWVKAKLPGSHSVRWFTRNFRFVSPAPYTYAEIRKAWDEGREP